MRRLTATPWFRGKTVGWGLSPTGWQGWATTLGYVVLLALALLLPMPWLGRVAAGVVVTLAFILVAYLTSTWAA